ncbi:hypothetical protein MUBE_02140 [Mycobacterium uberis]|uniref:GGDEF domain-containing protein n=1 Tax=Mycobacterium uberis TaxID=2162698 RepID=A0A3E1HJU1_9MYCO|nr:hypothetical protein MUBE_02140 [Mycobacterium uberis]
MFTQQIRDVFVDESLVARFGGDEFVVMPAWMPIPLNHLADVFQRNSTNTSPSRTR